MELLFDDNEIDISQTNKFIPKAPGPKRKAPAKKKESSSFIRCCIVTHRPNIRTARSSRRKAQTCERQHS